MDNTYKEQMNNILFKLSDLYNEEPICFDNCIGEDLLGKLVLHRVENIVYRKVVQNKINFGEFTKEFEKVYKTNMEDIEFYEEALFHVCTILQDAEFDYALLKGAYLITNVYDKGLRYSNDIDILIDEKDVDRCQRLLLKNGFLQGHIINGEVCKASRKDIILSRMNYGETVPFYKLYLNKFIIVDINFSLDYKPESENRLISKMLENTVDIPWKKTNIKTLEISNFIIHLCMHLYKEATTLDWVKRRKDLNLYKFNDLNVVFHKCVDGKGYEKLKKLIKDYGVGRECYYALFFATKIYKSLLEKKEYIDLLNSIKPDDISYLSQIIDPENKKIYMHNMSFEKWFACENRVNELFEICNVQ